MRSAVRTTPSVLYEAETARIFTLFSITSARKPLSRIPDTDSTDHRDPRSSLLMGSSAPKSSLPNLTKPLSMEGKNCREESWLAEYKNRILAASIASGAPGRVKLLRRFLPRNGKSRCHRSPIPRPRTNRCGNRACLESRRRRQSPTTSSQLRSHPSRR
jgi:hypothetical protein